MNKETIEFLDNEIKNYYLNKGEFPCYLKIPEEIFNSKELKKYKGEIKEIVENINSKFGLNFYRNIDGKIYNKINKIKRKKH